MNSRNVPYTKHPSELKLKQVIRLFYLESLKSVKWCLGVTCLLSVSLQLENQCHSLERSWVQPVLAPRIISILGSAPRHMSSRIDNNNLFYLITQADTFILQPNVFVSPFFSFLFFT